MKYFLSFFVITIAAIFINYYPHYHAYKHTPSNYVFSGQASWFDPWDINNYFASIRRAQTNKSFLVENWNTTEAVPKTFIYPIYTAAGILFPTINPVKIYYVLVIISAIILCLTIFIVSCWFLPNRKLALTALFLTIFGGGFGWLIGDSNQSADIGIPGVTLLSAFQKPHEAWAFILFIFSLTFFYFGIVKNNYRLGLVSVLVLISLIPIYPYRLAVWFLICGLFLLLRGGNKFFYIFGVMTAGVLGMLYAWHFLTSGFAVLTSYQPTSIDILSLVFGYGIFGIIFIIQLFLKLENNNERLFLNIWCVVSLVLSFWPGLGRLFLAGTIFPLVLICILTYKNIAVRFQISSLTILVIILILSPLSTFFIFDKRIEEAGGSNIWFYLPQNVNNGLMVLRDLPKDGVLVLPPLTSYVSAQTGKKVYFGHQDQTPDILNRQSLAIYFYTKKFSPPEALNFLKKNNINYIVYTSEPQYDFLSKIYENKDFKVLTPP